jgi:hypothetical protein
MAYDPERITYFAETDFRNKHAPFGIKAKDRTKHVYVIGKTGMGKSTTLENMAIQDIRNGEGFTFLDPHGATAEKLLEYVPPERMDDVLYFAPFDMNYPISFNVMEDVGPDKRHLVASGLMSAFKKIWLDAWSARMEYILNNTILALLEYPGSTLISINRMFADKSYREEVVSNITDTAVKAFWTEEFANYTDRFAAEATPAIQNKVGQFVSNPVIRNIIGQPKSSFDIREMMDNKKIIIVNLSKGRVGEDNANLLGSMLITKIYLAALSRADVSPAVMETLPNFYLYVDEFQSFANESFANILSEARKYKLNLTIAHQYIEQMSEEVRAAVFGNVGTMISFRVGAFDAEILEKEFAPQFTAEDMVNLGFAQVYLKLMIDGVSSAPFSATTLPPIPLPKETYVKEIIDRSREQYAISRDQVEDDIRNWHEMSYGSGQPTSKGGSQNQRKGGKKGGSSKISGAEKEKLLQEAISMATLSENTVSAQQKRRRDDKGPSQERLEELRQVIPQESGGGKNKEKKQSGNAPDADGFMGLEQLKNVFQGTAGESEERKEQRQARDASRGGGDGIRQGGASNQRGKADVSRGTNQRDADTDDEMEELRRKRQGIGNESPQPSKQQQDSSLSGLKNVMSGIMSGEKEGEANNNREFPRQSRNVNNEESEGQNRGRQNDLSTEERLRQIFQDKP